MFRTEGKLGSGDVWFQEIPARPHTNTVTSCQAVTNSVRESYFCPSRKSRHLPTSNRTPSFDDRSCVCLCRMKEIIQRDFMKRGMGISPMLPATRLTAWKAVPLLAGALGPFEVQN